MKSKRTCARRQLLAAVFVIFACAASAEVRPIVVEGAPFPLTVAEWTPPARDFPITGFGAEKGGAKPVTEAIEAAVAAAAKAGGGRVTLPPGEWISGAFRLKSNVALVIEKGATLHFPDDPVVAMRAPLRPDGRPTLTHQGLIEAIGCTNVAVMGEGTILCDVRYWHDNFSVNPQRGFPRPGLLRFSKCRSVRLEGLKVRGSPGWTLHLVQCEDIVMRGVDSVCTGPNTDGLDLESCNRALVEDCSLDQTDDTYTIKSGRNEAGRKRNVPTQNVVIRRCRAVNGHALLAIGSEVSGGIRNIYMTDCTVQTEAWRFLVVKTNAKRGAFVENVWLENVKGLKADSVCEIDMFYDGNPNKELDKKLEKTWPTAISNVVVRNVTCGEAKRAVRVRGDAEKPPVGIVVENVRVGKVTDRLVRCERAPGARIENVREDPAALREVLGLPPQARACDPAKDGRGAPAFDLAELESLAANTFVRRVLSARIGAEVKKGRNVAPRVTPPAPLEKSFRSYYSRAVVRILAELGCALPEAWVADDVRKVAMKELDGVTLNVAPDAKTGELAVTLANGGKRELKDVWCVVHLAPQWMTRRRTFRVDRVAPGETVVRILPFGAGAHYMPRPVGEAPYAASVDFTAGGARRRVWALAKTEDEGRAPNFLREVRHAGPLDETEIDDAALERASGEAGPLPTLGRGGWKGVAFPGAAWYNASPRPRPYTPEEAALARAGRAWEVVAVQFDVPKNAAPTKLRSTLPHATKKAVAFLNGERIPIKDAAQKIPVKEGRNRLVVKYPSQAGGRTWLLQMSVTQDGTTCWPCAAFPAAANGGRGATALPGAAVGGTTALPEFALEWNERRDAGVPYEVEVQTNKLAAAGLRPGEGLAVRALSAKGARDLATTMLRGRAEGGVFLRFAVPAGTTGLVCRATGKKAAFADPAEADNLFGGALASTGAWKATPRMGVARCASGGGLDFSVKSPGSPEATFDVAVPAGLRGKPVRFEADAETDGECAFRQILEIRQLDASGKRLPENVVDRRWTCLMMPAKWSGRFSETGRLHPEAATVQVFLSLSIADRKHDRYGMPLGRPAAMPRLRFRSLALRPAETLPFPRYDDANFAAGVSGERGDGAIRLGGPDARAFWYQTRSQASWANKTQLRDERQIFFPAGAGTVEAWFRSDWKPSFAKNGKGEKECRPITLFQSYQSYRAHFCIGGKGTMLSVSYFPEPGRLTLLLRDRFRTTYKGEADVTLPAGAWCHVAAQWEPGRTAELFVDGRRVMELPVPELKALDLADKSIDFPNDEGGLEFFLGSTWQAAKQSETGRSAEFPLFDGAADSLRVSTGRRYASGGFAPAKAFAPDGDTRALFAFDRTFDGLSGGGAGFVPGTTQSYGAGRVARDLALADGRKVSYWPRGVPPSLDPHVVLDVDNYRDLPTPDDFAAMRRPFRRTATLRPGESLSLDCPEGVVSDFIEIANESDRPLAYPVVLNDGEVDPRSYGDIADSLDLASLPQRARADRLFGFVLASMDYFMNHTAMFDPGSDLPRDVEYQAMRALNGYCGFECGPLNNLAANLFVQAAGLPAVQTGGYGHSFQQTFYDGKSHVYDVSFRRFFPAMDNETVAGLGDSDDESGVFMRLGVESDCFVRKSTRGHWVQNPDDVARVGVTLNPGERFRVWRVNDGRVNDLIARTKKGPYRGYASKWRPDATELCHADTEKTFLQQTERAFPDYLSGFILFDGAPTAGNPAFSNAAADSFCYRVASGGYPIVWADYAATRKDGSRAALEISTDGGKTFRPLSSPADYAVRAREAYLVRVKAPIGDVARFAATTEVTLNPRVYPGRLRAGANRLTLKAASGEGARVTVQGRAPAGRVEIPAAVSFGAKRGAETLFYAFDAEKGAALEVRGLSPKATVRATEGLEATLEGGRIVLAAVGGTTALPGADGGRGATALPGRGGRGARALPGADGGRGARALPGARAMPRFGYVTLLDGGAEKILTVLYGKGVRFATARDATVSGGARRLEPDATSPQARGLLKAAQHNAEVKFAFDPLPAGRYAVLNLNRFVNAEGAPPEPVIHDTKCLRMIWEGAKSTDAGSPQNLGCNFKRTRFGLPGGPANFKWDYAWQEGTGYPYPSIRVAELPAGGSVAMRSWSDRETVEVAAVLVVPDPPRDLRCDITKILCGLNCDPARISNER